MKFTVISAHRSNYPNPIGFASGDRVTVTGKRDDEFPGWVWVRTGDGNEGWAPAAWLDRVSAGSADATADYCARELDTEVGELLEGQEELAGWYWCRAAAGTLGWVPGMTVRRVD